MPAIQLASPASETLFDRVNNLEADVQAHEAVGLLGPHVYAGAWVPQATTSGTDTAGVATTIWVGELRNGNNVQVTGISFLIGSVGGTDKVIVVLYDVNGNVVASSALAGTTVGTAATMQRVPFTAPVVIGPGLYYVGVSTNGTTAKVRTQTFGDTNAGSITGQTFGTLAKITPPTTFTASTAPIAMLY